MWKCSINKKSQQTQVGGAWGKWQEMLRDISKPTSIVTNVIYVNKSHWFEKFLQQRGQSQTSVKYAYESVTTTTY